jgi:[ribosomal protein S5]-alanine N-acetyltransferase
MELNCGRWKVRSWRPEDRPSIVRHGNNRKIWLYLRDRFPHPYTEPKAEAWIRTALSGNPETQFAIEVSGEAAGGIGFTLGTDVERYSAEVGYWLGEVFWGQGICTAVLRTTTRYAMEVYPLNRIFALPFSENPASVRVLEKAGYAREGYLRRSAFKNGRFVDQVIYTSILEGWTPRDRSIPATDACENLSVGADLIAGER